MYDQLENLYRHFKDAAPRSVAVAKISKVLHVKRPAAYPVLDRRITAIYSDTAAAAAREYPTRGYRRAFWAAIRTDLIANTESGAFGVLRKSFEDAPGLREGLTSVTDLRLLDMLTWDPPRLVRK